MTDHQRGRVLMTGATGYIASRLRPTFEEPYDLWLVDARGVIGYAPEDDAELEFADEIDAYPRRTARR